MAVSVSVEQIRAREAAARHSKIDSLLWHVINPLALEMDI